MIPNFGIFKFGARLILNHDCAKVWLPLVIEVFQVKTTIEHKICKTQILVMAIVKKKYDDSKMGNHKFFWKNLFQCGDCARNFIRNKQYEFKSTLTMYNCFYGCIS